MDLGILRDVLGAVIGAAAGGKTVLSTFKLVKEGEQGIKLRFGKAVRCGRGARKGQPKVYEAGLALLIPFVDGMYTRHVRVQTLELQGQSITIGNGLSYVVDAVVRFKVKNVYNALFVVDQLDMVMNNVAMAVLRSVLTPTPDSAGMSHTDKMSEKLTAALKSHDEEWGVDVEEFSIISCVPTSESQQIVNAAAAVQVRFKALEEVLGPGVAVSCPQLAAALVGVPVAVNISASSIPTRSVKPVTAESKPEAEGEG